MSLSVISSFSSVRFEANLEKKLEICWPVRNSELVKRRFPLLSLAVIMDLATDAAPAFWPVADYSVTVSQTGFPSSMLESHFLFSYQRQLFHLTRDLAFLKATCGVTVSVFIALNIFLHLGHTPTIKIYKAQF